MLAYAANAPRHSQRPSSPHTMLVIVAVHVAAVAALMSAKMDLTDEFKPTPTVVDLIPEDEPPPPRPLEPKVDSSPRTSTLDQPEPLLTLPADPIAVDPRPVPLPSLEPIPQPRLEPQPSFEPAPRPAPVKAAARLLTHPDDLKPPYPASKIASGEEAALRLRLTIDERGRVVAVEPIGPADRTFLDTARRHLLARWRYRPATEDGRAVRTSLVITLRFQLEG